MKMRADWKLRVGFVSLLGVRVDCFMTRGYFNEKKFENPWSMCTGVARGQGRRQWCPAPPFHVWPTVATYIQYCIFKMCPPLLLGMLHPKFLAYLILCFERRYPKQNIVARLTLQSFYPKNWWLATPLCTWHAKLTSSSLKSSRAGNIY